MRTINLMGVEVGTYETTGQRDWDIWEYNNVTLSNEGMELLGGFPRNVDCLIVQPCEGRVDGYMGCNQRPDFMANLKVKK